MQPHKELKVVVYVPDSGLRNPVKLIAEIINEWLNSFGLAWQLFLRDLKSEYRQSIFGLTWAAIPPLVSAALWIFLNKQQIISIDSPGLPYPVFVIISMLLWSSFAQSLVMPIQAMNKGRSIMAKLNFPKEALLLAGLFEVIFDLLIRIGMIVIVLAIFKIGFFTTMLLAPIGIISLIMLGFTIGILVLPIGMLFTDISRIIQMSLPLLMLLTPVIYPQPRGNLGIMINRFNPVSPIITTARDWIFGKQALYVNDFLTITGITLLALGIGMILFKIALPFIIERSGS